MDIKIYYKKDSKIMKNWFKKIIEWLKDVRNIKALKDTLESALNEVGMLKEALMQFADEKEAFEARIQKYKKQIKDLKDRLKEFESEDK